MPVQELIAFNEKRIKHNENMKEKYHRQKAERFRLAEQLAEKQLAELKMEGQKDDRYQES